MGYPPLFDSKLTVISDMGGLIVALDPSDKVVWSYPLHGPFDPVTSPRGTAAWSGDRLYVNDGDELTVLNVRDGATVATNSVKESDPVNGAAIDGALITPFLHAKDEYHIGRFDPDLKWSVPTDNASATLAAGDGYCVYQPDSRRVGALELATGKEAWNSAVDGMVVSAPIIWEGSVYLGVRGGLILSLDLATGKKKWRRKVEINNPSPQISPSIPQACWSSVLSVAPHL